MEFPKKLQYKNEENSLLLLNINIEVNGTDVNELLRKKIKSCLHISHKNALILILKRRLVMEQSMK
jgi:hypothetical protein